MKRSLLLISLVLLLSGCAISPFQDTATPTEKPADQTTMTATETPKIEESESDIKDPGFDNAKKELDLVE